MPRYPQFGFSAPEGSTLFTLVRHGQSEPADPEHPFPLKDGHGDPALTELGHRQATAVGQRLGGDAIDHIYVSTLVRTHQTAAPLAAALELEPRVEADLREVFLGEFEGGVFRHMAAQSHPAIVRMRELGEWATIPGAETNAELMQRTRAALERIHDTHRSEHVTCFVHGGVIAALCATAAETTMRHFAGADNASIHRLLVTDDRWFLRSFNDINHLDGLRTPTASTEQPA